MSKYRKKPVVIDAVQFTGHNQKEIIDFTDGAARRVAMSMTVHTAMTIPTLEGNMRADVGDYIIKEPFDKQRGFYPCKPDIFEMTYEEVEDDKDVKWEGLKLSDKAYDLIPKNEGDTTSYFLSGQKSANEAYRAEKPYSKSIHHFNMDVQAGYQYEWSRMNSITMEAL